MIETVARLVGPAIEALLKVLADAVSGRHATVEEARAAFREALHAGIERLDALEADLAHNRAAADAIIEAAKIGP